MREYIDMSKFILTLLFGLTTILVVSCSNQENLAIETIELEEKEEYQNSDTSSFIVAYKNMLSKCTDEREKKFMLQLMGVFEEFSDKTLDTTLYTTCFIDADEKLDTIKTRVFEKKDKIIVHYSWTKNGKLLWEKEFGTPYLWIKDAPFFYNEKWKKWITFTIGTYYALPEILNIDYFKGLDDWEYVKKMAVEIGVHELQKLGVDIDEKLYEQYIENFNRNLIAWGDPESRADVYIWYEPLQRFIGFYSA